LGDDLPEVVVGNRGLRRHTRADDGTRATGPDEDRDECKGDSRNLRARRGVHDDAHADDADAQTSQLEALVPVRGTQDGTCDEAEHTERDRLGIGVPRPVCERPLRHHVHVARPVQAAHVAGHEVEKVDCDGEQEGAVVEEALGEHRGFGKPPLPHGKADEEECADGEHCDHRGWE
jgi:hypothetical protein